MNFYTLVIGRPYGGVAFLWRRSIDKWYHRFKDLRVIYLRLTLQGYVLMILISVYMPVEGNDNFDVYVLYTGLIKALLEEHSVNSTCYVIGDFSAAIDKKFFNELTRMSLSGGNTVLDVGILERDSYNFMCINDTHSSTSGLIILYAKVKVNCVPRASLLNMVYIHLITSQYH